jgi:catechol 2,3-dioxygenase-like lactoylglutathione lyase family enzyme
VFHHGDIRPNRKEASMASLADYPVWTVLAASDIGRARTWYEEKLGLTPAREDQMGGLWYRFAGGTWLLVYPTPNAGTAKNTQAHFEVPDLVSLVQDLRSRGVVFEEYDFGEMGKTEGGIMEAMGWKSAWFKDSEGNTFEVAQPQA